MRSATKPKLDPRVRKLLQLIVGELADTEPDWFLDSQTVIGRVYAEAVLLLHQELAQCWDEQDGYHDE